MKNQIALALASFWLLLNASVYHDDVLASTISSYENIQIAGEITPAELEKFKQQKGAVVVDLREARERGPWEQAEKAKKLGLTMKSAEFSTSEPIQKGVIDSISAAVKEAGKKPVLVYCKSGNRASAWLAIHLIKTQKMPEEKAFEIARKTGLREAMEDKVREYLRANPDTK